MAETTGIAWCDHTWSPWIGCTKVSPGCDHCYAEALDTQRFSKTMGNATKANPIIHWGAGAPRYLTKSWDVVVLWNKKAAAAGERRTVFPSLCDPFDNEVSAEWCDDFLTLVHCTPALTWLLLTKRIGNARKMLEPYFVRGLPLPNVWLGASVVNQEEADRDIPKLLATPAAKHFVSYEPALGPVDFEAIGPMRRNALIGGQRLDWIIVGGESSQGGAKARPFALSWARAVVAQCRATGVPSFVKQLGSTIQAENGPGGCDILAPRFRDRSGADPAEWPEDLRVQEFPEET